MGDQTEPYSTTSGWYPDPATGQLRWFDGQQWGPYAPPTQPAGVVVTGPNHALHFILSVLTFWACGGWIWVWLLVALVNSRQVRPVDAYGRPIVRPKQGPTLIDRIDKALSDENGNLDPWKVLTVVAVGAGVVVLVFVVLLLAA